MTSYVSKLNDFILQHLQSSGLPEEILAVVSAHLEEKSAEDSRLYSMVRFAAEFSLSLNVTSSSGLTCLVEAHLAQRVTDLKGSIEAAIVVPCERQQLVYNGQTMEDEKLLFHYRVSPLNPEISLPGSEVSLTNASPGGVYAFGADDEFGISSDEVFDPQRQRWYQLTPMLTKRQGFAVAFSEGKIYVTGGSQGPDPVASAEVFDLSSSTWTELPPMSQARHLPAALAVSGKICVLAGQDASGNATDICEAFDPSSQTWLQLPSMPTRRKGFAYAASGNTIYTVGGKNDDVVVTSFESFNAETSEWSKLPQTLDKRDPLSVVIAGERLYACGGHAGFDCCHANVQVFDLVSSSWSHMPPMNTRRVGCGVVGLAGKIYALGGYDGVRCLSSMEMFDPETNTWQLAPSMSTKRRSLAATVLHGRIYALGGIDLFAGNTKPVASAEVFDPEIGWKSLQPLSSAGIALALAVS